MYRCAPNGLGFSLKPPAWLTNLVGGANQVVTALNPAANPTPTPTSLNVSADTNPIPSWVVPAGVGLLIVLLGMRSIQRGQRR